MVKYKTQIVFLVLMLSFTCLESSEIFTEVITDRISKMMNAGNIPGLSISVAVDDTVANYSFGYSDIRKKARVNSRTLFETGSLSKAFTALAFYMLEQEGRASIYHPVSQYIEWFRPVYKGEKKEILIKHLIHHTSGIDWRTLSDIPENDSADALEKTVRIFSSVELKNEPGSNYHYATLNYDIIGLIISIISEMPFEDYLESQIFKPLGMADTSVGFPKHADQMSRGYKTGFFKPRDYAAPVYRGNWPAGYVLTNAGDMSKWLEFQVFGRGDESLAGLIGNTRITYHTDDGKANNYAAGWEISADGSISHEGINPNFTSYIAISPEEKVGVAVLANSNSTATGQIGEYLFKLVSGQDPEPPVINQDEDNLYSFISIILAFILIGSIINLFYILRGIRNRKRVFTAPGTKITILILFYLLILTAVLYLIYNFPQIMSGFSWRSAIVWSPPSFLVLSLLFPAAVMVISACFLLPIFFPSSDKYLRSLPGIVMLSLVSGIANASVIWLVINSVTGGMDTGLMAVCFLAAAFIYIFGRKIIETKLLKLTYVIITDMRIRLIEKIFTTTYQKFENIESGKIFATLNNDTAVLGSSANLIVSLLTSMITIIFVFIYLATISLAATIFSLSIIAVVAVLYYFISKLSEKYYNAARETQNRYMSQIRAMLDGIKELSISRIKKSEYQIEIAETAEHFRNNSSIAGVKFINSFLIGESLLVLILGFVSFGFPIIFPEIQSYVLMSFLMVFLYLIGPINGILNSVPGILQIKIAWARIQDFKNNLPVSEIEIDRGVRSSINKEIHSITLESIEYKYPYRGIHDTFVLGPIDLEVSKGEIVFIVGGNGSGKTTLANILTGLYKPDSGRIKVNGIETSSSYDLGELYSAVFSDNNLFGKIYGVDVNIHKNLINENIKKFYLEGKVSLENGSFNTIKLSSGQRKRLSLIKCIVEDSPIYLFDEVAADQDPDFKRYFYKELLLQMKTEGKIVIAITHDDHYFDVADKIIKMDSGKIEFQLVDK